MDIRKCILTNNDCYKAGLRIKPKRIVVHSTGANNKTLKRYVQPDDGTLGTNKYNNSWNRPKLKKCVHAFIGCVASGAVMVYQTLPWDMRSWGCGKGKKGSYNDSAIQFEICEDNLKDISYFNAAFEKATDLCAYLCIMYDIPVSEVVSHKEAHKRGYASGHGDCDHWLKKHGKDMDWFRSVVADKIAKATDKVVKANDAIVWDFLKSKGMTDIAAAGAMGNMHVESPGFRSGNLQNAYEKESRLNMSDAEYTQAIDEGKYVNFVHDGAGYGICQWTFWSRKQNLLNFAKAQGKSIGDLQMQLDFMWKELQGYKGVVDRMNEATTIREASDIFLLNYEKPARKDEESVQVNRANYGQTYYDKFAKGIEQTVEKDSAYVTFVKGVQKACGAKVDGVASTSLLSRTVTISSVKNNRHAVVKPVQQYLNDIGYPCGTADGIFGSKTRNAVINYQKANGCISDGEITAGKKTWKKLLKL